MSRLSFALSLAAGLAIATPTLAADMYGGPQAAPAYGYTQPTPATNWNGVYIGGQIGNGWGSRSMDGAQLGIYGGLNTNLGSNVIAGVEADLNVSGQSVNRWVGADNYTFESNWNATIRPRLGVTFDRFMPYATAGLALADDSVKTIGASSSTTKIGYAAGAGIEAQIIDHVSVKGEFMHTGFARSTHTLGSSSVSSAPDSNMLRGGVAYRF